MKPEWERNDVGASGFDLGRVSHAMIKLIYCFRKRPGMSDAEFDRYWRDVHGPVAARIPGLRRLVQSRALDVPGDVRRPDYDGVAELWFDDVHALLEARRSAEWRRSEPRGDTAARNPGP